MRVRAEVTWGPHLVENVREGEGGGLGEGGVLVDLELVREPQQQLAVVPILHTSVGTCCWTSSSPF